MTITGHTGTADYDGTGHSVSGFEVQISSGLYSMGDLVFTPAADADLDADGVIRAARTNAGITAMGLAAEQFTN